MGFIEDKSTSHKIAAKLARKEQANVDVPGKLAILSKAPSLSGNRAGAPDVFISYSHRDQLFALQLVDALAQRKYTAWIDKDENNVFPAGEFREDIKAGIEEAGAFIFVLSPNSIVSEECHKELIYAEECGKKLIPLLYRRIDPSHAPQALRELHWIEDASFDRMLEKVLNALLTDKDDWQHAGRWLRLGNEWKRNRKQNSGLLLHGKELKKAEDWLKKAERWQLEGSGRKPQPQPSHIEFIRASRRVTNRLLLVRLIVLILFVSLTAGGAFAFLYHDPTRVTNLNDDGWGSLRWDIANASSGSTIIFDKSVRGFITLTSGDLIINKKLTIDGPGAMLLVIQSRNNSAIRISEGASVDITDLSFRDSTFTNTQSFIINEGRLLLSGSIISGNEVNQDGGGINNSRTGTLMLMNSAISNNKALGATNYAGDGGGILNGGALTLINSTVSGNSASRPSSSDPNIWPGSGGGIFNGGALTLINSTVSGNSAGFDGGGIANLGIDNFTATNSTVAGNTSSHAGGGIFNYSSHMELVFCTIANNSSVSNWAGWGGGIYVGDAQGGRYSQTIISNSLVATNHANIGADLAGDLISGTVNLEGYSLIQSSDPRLHRNGSILPFPLDTQHLVPVGKNANIKIDQQLRQNGGATETLALLAGSPAIDAIPVDVCKQSGITSDQRGITRPQGKGCDIGAYEYRP